MKKKTTYRTEHVEQVRVSELLPVLMAGCIVAVDVAKAKFVVALATWAGEIVKLFRFEHPTETTAFLALFAELQRNIEPSKLRVAMEPTGTYGDAIRHQLHVRGAEIHMVSPKRTHDAHEMFDGVPSMHDPKAAVVIAKLSGLELSKAWTPAREEGRRLRALVDMRSHALEHQQRCLDRLEALLARHWPEFPRWLDLREQRSAVALLERFPGPKHVSADDVGVREFLRTESRGRLSKELIEGVLQDAASTLGVPMVTEECQVISVLASQIRSATRDMDLLESEIRRVGEHDEAFARLVPVTGAFTAAVIVTYCDPRRSRGARQFEKSCGLNLREYSSGEHRGRVAITKRGPALVRQVLYLFALRMLNKSAVVNAWYVLRKGHTESSKARAVIAVMRKLVKALFHVSRGQPFDAAKLFDMRRLKLETDAAHAPRPTPTPRTTARSSVAGMRTGHRAQSAPASP